MNTHQNNIGRIEWNQSFSVGIERLDHQHKKLLEILNGFLETVEAQNKKVRDLAVPFLRGFAAYYQMHFREEEDLMRQLQHSFFVSHMNEHTEIKKYLKTIIAQWNDAELTEKIGFATFLRYWVAEHIQTRDVKIGEEARQNRMEINNKTTI